LGLAGWADEAVWPAFLEEKPGACGVIGESLAKGGLRHKLVVSLAAPYENKKETCSRAVKQENRYP
jgi:hypothetical protein